MISDRLLFEQQGVRELRCRDRMPQRGEAFLEPALRAGPYGMGYCADVVRAVVAGDQVNISLLSTPTRQNVADPMTRLVW